MTANRSNSQHREAPGVPGFIHRRLESFLRRRGYTAVPCAEKELAGLDDTVGAMRELLTRNALVLQAGEIGISEAKFLGGLVQRCSAPGPIVEIGTLFGWSTRVMALFKERSQVLITVDNCSWNPLGLQPDTHRAILEEILLECTQRHDVNFVSLDKNRFYEEYDGDQPCMVFLDADHSYEETRRDIAWAQAQGAQIICGHDFDEERFPGVVKAVREFGGPSEIVDTLWVL